MAGIVLGAGDAVMAGQGLTTGAIGASTRGRREGFFGSHTWIPDFLSGDPSAGMFQPRTGHRGLLPPQNSPAFPKQGSLLQTLLCPVKSDLPTKGKHTGPYPSVTPGVFLVLFVPALSTELGTKNHGEMFANDTDEFVHSVNI